MATLRQRLFVRREDLADGEERLALKEVHLNKTPMLLPPTMLDEATAHRLGLDRAANERHWQVLANLTLAEQQALRGKLMALYGEQTFAEQNDPEQMLYSGGFFDEHDKRLMQKIRAMSAQDLATASLPFKDARLGELLFRYRARNFPTSLTPPEAQRWREFCRWRLTHPEAGAGIVWDQFQQRLAELSAEELTSSQRQLLKDLTSYADSLIRRVQ